MLPRTTPRRSSSYRHSFISFSFVDGVIGLACCAAECVRSEPMASKPVGWLPRLEDVLEQPLPLLLLVPGKDCGNDFPLLQHVADMRGIDRYVKPGRHAPAPGEELLGLPAHHEVRRQQRGLGVRRLRADADR